MLKYITLFIVLFSFCQKSRANKVDDLKTEDDVVKFINSLDSKFTGKYSMPMGLQPSRKIFKEKECGSILNWDIKNWQKLDLNGDGKKDLLVNGYWNNGNNGFAAIDKGDGTFKLITLSYSLGSKCEVVKPIKIDGKQLVLFHSIKYLPGPGISDNDAFNHPLVDTLIYKFDDFIEYNRNATPLEIKSVKFTTGLCYGTCPVFTIEIDKSGKANYSARQYDIKAGNFKSYIKSDNLNEIYDLLSYIKVDKLRDNYQISATDFPTCSLDITFNDGTVKHIDDYGELGTFGLRKLYSLFFDLRKNQYWEKN